MKEFSLNTLKENEYLKIYSKTINGFGDETIEIYKIIRREDGFYIEYNKRVGLEDYQDYSFEEKIKEIGYHYLDKQNLKNLNLTKLEKEVIYKNSFAKNKIKIGCDVEGILENGLRFVYPNIIYVDKLYEKEGSE